MQQWEEYEWLIKEQKGKKIKDQILDKSFGKKIKIVAALKMKEKQWVGKRLIHIDAIYDSEMT